MTDGGECSEAEEDWPSRILPRSEFATRSNVSSVLLLINQLKDK